LLEAGGVTALIPSTVWRHFRDLHQVRGSPGSPDSTFSVVDWPFSHRSRTEYAKRLTVHLAEVRRPKLVLLDPDTGIASRSSDARGTTLAPKSWRRWAHGVLHRQ
jgi:hypothetical protein